MNQHLIIGFSKSTKIFRPYSCAIIFYDKLRYKADNEMSHLYGKFVSMSWDRNFIYQAAGARTHFTTERNFLVHNEIVEEYKITLPEKVFVRIGQIAADREGKPYAIKQTLGIALIGFVWILSLGQFKINNPFSDGDAEVNCIEEWVRILSQALEIEEPENMDSQSVFPIRNWIKSLPEAKLIYKKEN